ncbi:MAG: orotidine-5'-phosphate decarboxylase [Planctomycetales bacterium]|nr:orotidine-5'-phosphate decarboxylase [Planctomycetales bacterium]
MANHFADRLASAVKQKNTPLVVGLDPVYARLPESIRVNRFMNDETDVTASVDAIFTFCARTLKIVAPLVPAVKINIGYFERYFWEGLETYYALVSEAEALGLEVIGDVKRGDIGHTAAAYAEAHLQNPEFSDMEDILVPDAITINGFAGAEGILPFADMADEQGKGVFVWVRASNRTAASIQDFADAAGVKMYEKLAQIVGEIAVQSKRIGSSGYSNIGMVIGGTSPEETTVLRQRYPQCWFLVPGFGSQGATAADCVRFCNRDGLGALINASRSILYAFSDAKYKDQFGDNWEKCIEQATIDAKIELAKAKG